MLFVEEYNLYILMKEDLNIRIEDEDNEFIYLVNWLYLNDEIFCDMFCKKKQRYKINQYFFSMKLGSEEIHDNHESSENTEINYSIEETSSENNVFDVSLNVRDASNNKFLESEYYSKNVAKILRDYFLFMQEKELIKTKLDY